MVTDKKNRNKVEYLWNLIKGDPTMKSDVLRLAYGMAHDDFEMTQMVKNMEALSTYL